MPNIPTKTAVNTLSPIWNFQIPPILFIQNRRMPPNIELPIILNILFNGNTNILPKINKKIMHAK